MFPGLTSKLSEAVIALTASVSVKTDILRVTDTTSTTVLETLVPNFGGGVGSGLVWFLNATGQNITTVTSGNILTAKTLGADVAIAFVYSKSQGKWYPGALA
jgi:NADPH:quinone reductase-like Zn-dependent oxidoreductase